FCLSLLRPLPPRTTLFPYTTLFRSLMRYCPGKLVIDLAQPANRNAQLPIIERPCPGGRIGYIEEGVARVKDRADLLVRLIVETADRKSTRLNSSHVAISYAVFCLKK